jgi:hypothetical protein
LDEYEQNLGRIGLDYHRVATSVEGGKRIVGATGMVGYPVQPRREPTFSYRVLRAIYPVFQVLFPNQVIRGDDLARTMVDAALRDVEAERQTVVLENRNIRALAAS